MTNEPPQPNNANEWSYLNPIPPRHPPEGETAKLVKGRYELQGLIGRGSTSRIYRASDHVLGRIVAVKFLREELGDDPKAVARFYREARAVAALTNEHIVQIYDYGQDSQTYFIVMQYVEGFNLKELLRRENTFAPAPAITIISQVLEALAAAHANQVIHRDVKPQNILIRSSDGLVKLTDFGVAHVPDQAAITTLGAFIGTVYYMAPEQISGGVISPATDLYAAGVVLYELLAGRLPFEGTNQMQVALQHLHDTPPAFASLGVSVPQPLERVVERALTKNPARRYQSAEEMRQALEAALAPVSSVKGRPSTPSTVSQNVTSPQVRPRSKPRLPKFLLPLLVGLFLLSLAAVGWLGSQLLAKPNGGSNPSPNAGIIFTVQANTPTVKPATPVVESGLSTPLPTFSAAPTPNQTPTPTLPAAATTAAPAQASANTPGASNPVPNPTASLTVSNQLNIPFSPYLLNGAYKRDSGTLYGNSEVALYGSGSNYDQGTVSFNVQVLPTQTVYLNITGLDDELATHCNLQVVLNNVTIFNGADTFPNVPNGDTGESGSSRYWGQMQIKLPPNLLQTGNNSLILRNVTPWQGYIGVPYILISNFNFTTTA